LDGLGYNGFFGLLEFILVIWYIFGHLLIKWQIGIFFTILVYCVKKNLAALCPTTATAEITTVRPATIYYPLEMHLGLPS
jgi:hypothetical protein